MSWEATGLCHSDEHARTGDLPSLLPMVGGHEGAGIVAEVGPGVQGLNVGDHVVASFVPACGRCRWCSTGHQNLCDTGAIIMIGTQVDGSYRRHLDGRDIGMLCGVGSFSQYGTVHEASVVKIDDDLPLSRACLLGCGVTTGIGAVLNTAKVQPGDTVAVFGLGGIGLSAIIGAVKAKASRIIAVDINPSKFEIARQLGATDCVNPKDYDRPIQEVIVDLTDGGVDYSFECVGNVQLMRAALECCHKGWGESVIIGVAGAGQEIATRPFQLVTGRVWRGSAFGGVRGRSELPSYVEMSEKGEIPLDTFITHTMGLEDINKAFDLMHEGKSIRSVIHF